MRRHVWWLWVVFCASCASDEHMCQKASPNFVVVLVDDQAWNGTSVEMVPGMPESASDFHRTPWLDSLAQRGMRFSNARASAPVCAPSRYSIQFGKTPARLSVVRVGMNTDHVRHEALLSIPKALVATRQSISLFTNLCLILSLEFGSVPPPPLPPLDPHGEPMEEVDTVVSSLGTKEDELVLEEHTIT